MTKPKKRGRPKLTAEQRAQREEEKKLAEMRAKVAEADMARAAQEIEDAKKGFDTEPVVPVAEENTPVVVPAQKEWTREELIKITAQAEEAMRRELLVPAVRVEPHGVDQELVTIVPSQEYVIKDESGSWVPEIVQKNNVGWRPL